ncbi:hypothetical protein DXX93_02455 [Thalassotalea euphylliae]|uniref:Uncharacterized protein n=1 Tax=Thalassotalea euphylliae TaxID=1655234 RepID=A0A3E0TMM9_9GAMM|nr:hypothetical protein DXX93_02455 [Thalassotalea euphylliae]
MYSPTHLIFLYKSYIFFITIVKDYAFYNLDACTSWFSTRFWYEPDISTLSANLRNLSNYSVFLYKPVHKKNASDIY